MAINDDQPMVEQLLTELIEVANEQLRWQRAALLPDVRTTINDALTSTQLRKAFEAGDGEKSSTDIAKSVGVSKQAFSGWTRRWRDLGIAYEDKGKIRHLATLKSLELDIEIALELSELIDSRSDISIEDVREMVRQVAHEDKPEKGQVKAFVSEVSTSAIAGVLSTGIIAALGALF